MMKWPSVSRYRSLERVRWVKYLASAMVGGVVVSNDGAVVMVEVEVGATVWNVCSSEESVPFALLTESMLHNRTPESVPPVA